MTEGYNGVRSYYFSDLARAYCPDVTPRFAVRTLRRWIDINPRLRVMLADTGYTSGCRHLTPRQVGLIVSELGEP